MAELHTPRHALPELAVAQSQKEVTHNEAIRRIDSLLHPLIQGVLSSPPSDLAAADAGKCWLVGPVSTGGWADKVHNIATWTGASWRFHPPVEGMEIWDISFQYRRIFRDDEWMEPASIAEPTGGTMIDNEARNALVQLLTVLKIRGILAD